MIRNNRDSVKFLRLLIILLTFSSLLSSSQASLPSEQWKKTYGGTDKDWAVFVNQTTEGGYILAGVTFSYGAGFDDTWLIKTDSNGNQQWSKTFGGTGSDGANSVQQTSDGGFILAGVTMPDGTRGIDAWLIKTDASGGQEWNKTFGGTKDDRISFAQQTSDRGYILVGHTFSYGAGGGDAWVIKIDSKGNQQWSKTFGGNNFEAANSIQQTSDGGYVVAGLASGGPAESFQYTPDGRYTYTGVSFGLTISDVLLIKMDSSGNQQWSKKLGGESPDSASFVKETSDGGFILVGETGSDGAEGGDVWLIKTDSKGNQQWSRTFGGAHQEWGNSVHQTSDGGFILAGGTNGVRGADALLIKTDSSGNQQWNMTFGGPKDDAARYVQQTSDGGYILAGSTKSYGAGDMDVWLIKVSSEVLPAQTPTPTVIPTEVQMISPTQTPAAGETKMVSPTEKAMGFEIFPAMIILLIVLIIRRKRSK